MKKSRNFFSHFHELHGSWRTSLLLILSTAATLLVSWLITKAGSVRYLFGLPTNYNSFLPGSRLNGFSFLIVLIILYVAVIIFGIFK